MSEELFDIYQEDGKLIGQETRSETHRLALWHCSANVFCFHEDGRLLIQRRNKNKDVCPYTWDLSMAEHLQPGETYIQAAHRGLKEELGIVVNSLKPVGDRIQNRFIDQERGIYDFEFQQSFQTEYSGPIYPDRIEVADVKYVSLTELADQVEDNPEKFTPWFKKTAYILGYLPKHFI